MDAQFRKVAEALGYAVQGLNDEHSGQSYRLKYSNDYVKVDISYLARVPMLEPEAPTCQLADPPVAFPVLPVPELAAGKIKAMMERVAPRDLFDIYRLSLTDGDLLAEPLSRALAVRAICTADTFPAIRDPVVALDRYRNPAPELVEPLYSTLSADDAPAYDAMIEAVASWLSSLSALTDAEEEFMRLLDVHAEHRPELLFADWPDVLERASMDPVMEWKVRNLGIRSGG